MADLKPNKWYAKSEVDELILTNPAKIQKMGAMGYTMQFEPDKQRFRFVTLGTVDREAKKYDMTGVFEAPDPIQKRTPQARVDSLLRKWIEDCKAQGRVPGMSDQQIRDILGPQWTDGRMDITAEEVKTVGAWFINDAEQKRSAANFKRVARI